MSHEEHGRGDDETRTGGDSGPDPKKDPRPVTGRPGTGGPETKPSGRPKGFLFVAVFLALLIAMAAIFQGELDDGSIERNFYNARDLLLEGKIDTESMVLLRERKLLRAELLPDAHPEIKSVVVKFENDDQINRFRTEAIEAYNAKFGGVPIDWKVQEHGVWRLLEPFFWILAIGFLIYLLFIRPMRAGAGGNILTFGRSRARLATQGSQAVRFTDVAGIEEAKEEVTEVIEFLRNPGKFHKIGARIPRGIMLVGSPGTGKTLLAKAIAGEAGVPFLSICGSDFVEMFVGVGASRVRDLFKQARDSTPCIVFLDEVDAVGRRRGTGMGGGNDEREQTLNAILVEMDGFDSDDGVIMIAATNRPDVLDPALLRPGRFDREITIELPDLAGRKKILGVHAKGIQLQDDVDLSSIARATPGFSGAELAALVNEAAIIAALRDREKVSEEDLEEARDKVRFGRQRKSSPLDEEDRRITAYHEAGHALVAHLLPDLEPVHKVTIIPRGMALGATMQLPEKDRYHMSKKQVLGNLMLLYAGRIAEKYFCDDITAGAQNDIQRATDLARRMVCEWGMSDTIGPINYADVEEPVFLGQDRTRTRVHGESMAQKIDDEVKRVVNDCFQKSDTMIRKNKDAVVRVAEALLEKETLTGAEVAELIETKPRK